MRLGILLRGVPVVLGWASEEQDNVQEQDERPTWQDVFVGRQPILDTSLELFGYELLFRSETGSLRQIQTRPRPPSSQTASS